MISKFVETGGIFSVGLRNQEITIKMLLLLIKPEI